MGMTDRQFDAYQQLLLRNLQEALVLSPDNQKLKNMIEDIEANLKRP